MKYIYTAKNLSDVSEFVSDLYSDLLFNLKYNSLEKLEENVNEMIIGGIPEDVFYELGAYSKKEKRIYLSKLLCNSKDLVRISEIFFHEIGHVIFCDLEESERDESYADSLAIFCIGKERCILARKSFSNYRREIEDVFENKTEIKNDVENTFDKWKSTEPVQKLDETFFYYYITRTNKIKEAKRKL